MIAWDLFKQRAFCKLPHSSTPSIESLANLQKLVRLQTNNIFQNNAQYENQQMCFTRAFMKQFKYITKSGLWA